MEQEEETATEQELGVLELLLFNLRDLIQDRDGIHHPFAKLYSNCYIIHGRKYWIKQYNYAFTIHVSII